MYILPRVGSFFDQTILNNHVMGIVLIAEAMLQIIICEKENTMYYKEDALNF